MTREQAAVRKFMFITGQEISEDGIWIPDKSTKDFRVDLIQEELEELSIAQKNNDVIEVADALGDLLYVVYGTAEAWGIDIEPVFDEIHRSNMTKISKDGFVKRGANGKVLKPETYEAPNLKPIITKQWGQF